MSSTSFLFSTLHCQCQKTKLEQVASVKGTVGSGATSGKVCKEACLRCGKEIVPKGKRGGFISLLLRGFRCRCAKPLPGTGKAMHASKALQGTLATQFVPRSGNKTRQARLERQAVNRTQMVLSGVQNIALQDLHNGEIIANSYVLEEQIGLGGMGAVYRARHQMLGRLCALKFLLPSAVTATSWEMFKNEAKILNELQHPAICRIFDMGLHKGCLPFYAMEFLDGITLEELLNRKNTLGLGAALEIFIAVADALTYAHRQKIIHKDVKPANIMLVKAGKDVIAVKLLDFGIAELSESGATTEISEVAGSAAYMSPEQFTGRSLTPASDVYSLACSLFETLAGDAPFDGQNFEELSQQHQEVPAPTLKEVTGLDFPSDIEVVLEHALRKDPNRRYRYMSEITVDLQRILQGKPLQFARGETARLATACGDEANVGDSAPGFAKNIGRLRRRTSVLVGVSLLLGTSFLVIVLYVSGAMSKQSLVDLVLKMGGLTGATALPRYYHLTRAEYEKLDLSGPYNSKIDYYLFPADGESKLGKISLSWQKADPMLVCAASGLVKFPRLAGSSGLGLLLSSEVINNLELLDGFARDEVRHITFPHTDLAHSPSEVRAFWGTAGQTGQLLKALQNFSSVKSIDFLSVTVDDKCVELLNGFLELEELTFADGRLIPEAALGNLRRLSSLKVLRLPPVEDASPIFRSLAASQQLSDLELQNFLCSEKELAAFHCPARLRKFACRYSGVPVKLLEKLAACPHIEELDFSGSAVPPESAEFFLRMLWLKKLVLAEDLRSNWGAVRFHEFVEKMRRNGCLVVLRHLAGAFATSVNRSNKEFMVKPNDGEIEQILDDLR